MLARPRAQGSFDGHDDDRHDNCAADQLDQRLGQDGRDNLDRHLPQQDGDADRRDGVGQRARCTATAPEITVLFVLRLSAP
jgi:hypothetical protein